MARIHAACMSSLVLPATLSACLFSPELPPFGATSESAGDGTSSTSDPGRASDPGSTAATPTTTTGEPTSGPVMSTAATGTSVVDTTGPEDGGTNGTKECDQWAQDCPEGEKCMPYSGDGDNAWESLKCVPVMWNHEPGEPCTVEGSGVSGIDSCKKGAMCWNVDPETGAGVCVAMCVGAPDQPKCVDPETTCFNSNDGVLTLCLPKCDPLLQDCLVDELCIYNPLDTGAFVCVLDTSGEEGQEFDTCEHISGCDKGFSCANPALASECDPLAGGCCLAWCDLWVLPEICNGVGQECLPWFDMAEAPPELEDVGICGIPQ